MKKNYDYELHTAEGILSCKVIFADRKSISLRIEADGGVSVRAPRYATHKQINSFLEEKKDWIVKNRLAVRERMENAAPALSETQQNQVLLLEKRFRRAAAAYFPTRCAQLQQLTGGYYTKITIRNQKTRWGSCSQTGTLSFNYRLMMAPPAVIDYVIVHELCHLTHMNHSKAFWNKVAAILPDYAKSRRWLKENGHTLTEAHYLLSLM